jgi:hypothetical protein
MTLEERIATLERGFVEFCEVINRRHEGIARSLTALVNQMDALNSRLPAFAVTGEDNSADLAGRIARLEGEVAQLSISAWRAKELIEAANQIEHLIRRVASDSQDHGSGGEPPLTR